MLAFLRQFGPLVLAGCILIGGLLTSAIAFFSGFHNREYVALNAKTVVHLKPGEYEIFYEWIGDINGSSASAPMPSYPSGLLFDQVIAMVDDGRISLDLTEDTSDAYILKTHERRIDVSL